MAFERFTSNTEVSKTPEEIRAEGIARVLEACSENNKDIHVLEEALTVPRSKLSLLYDQATKKSRAYLGALVFAFAFQAHASQDQETTSTHASTESTSFSQEQLASQSIDGIKTLIEAARTADREVTISVVADKPAFTLVHIGQTHPTTAEQTYKSRNEIIESNKQIGSFLSKASPIGACVFLEGYTSEQEASFWSLEEITNDIQNANDIDELERLYKVGSKNTVYVAEQAVLNKITGDTLSSLGFKEISPLVYSNGSRSITFETTFAFPEETDYTVPNAVESGMAGVARVLDVKGYIDIVPAETSQGQERMIKLQAELQEKGAVLGKYFEPFSENDSNYKELSASLPRISEFSAELIEHAATLAPCQKSVECKKLATEIIDILIPALENAVTVEREDIAIELAGKSKKDSFVIFGSDHDFTRAVLKWNKEHPNQQMNLVTVKSKDKSL
jgi:hypothetical protein